MREIDAHNAAAYLIDAGRIPPGERLLVRELAGGVSNLVLLVERSQGAPFVLKQARERLRTPQPWFCSPERVLREIDVLRVCQELLRADDETSMETRGEQSAVAPSPIASTPRLLFEDRENYLFAMSAAPPEHTTWKQRLLAGQFDPNIAAACGRLLGRLHAGAWNDARLSAAWADRAFFDDLRLDPYYREVGRRFVDLKPAMDELIESTARNACTLVHGDFSPKNLLVWDDGLMLLDFEVGHFGDPAFDLGFFLSHLTLKTAFHRPRIDEPLALVDRFWDAYWKPLASRVAVEERRALAVRAHRHLGGCLLARVDGKSRVDYAVDVDRVRRLGRHLLQAPWGLDGEPWNHVRPKIVAEFG